MSLALLLEGMGRVGSGARWPAGFSLAGLRGWARAQSARGRLFCASLSRAAPPLRTRKPLGFAAPVLSDPEASKNRGVYFRPRPGSSCR